MKIALSPHGGSGNHGCEAIVRATKKILGDNEELELFSSSVEEDRRYGLEQCCKLTTPTEAVRRFSWGYLKARLTGKSEEFDKLVFAPILRAAQNSDLVMSIGGDNYCYGVNHHILLVNRAVRALGKPTVLWGCSIEPDAMENKIVFEDLAAFTRIIARESITHDVLIAKGLKQVKLYPDPAFQLDRIDRPLPDGFAEWNTVGINVSPMIIGYEGSEGATLSNYVGLVDHILNTSDMQVALVPHVVWHHNDDRKPLELLYERFEHTGRVVMIEDCTAPELKGYIARCRFFVAARTHASIAAYSECVPTLVVGYSVKARGIARDIFGTEEHYVVPVQSFEKGDELVVAFQYLYDHEASIRAHYASMMESYKAKAAEAKQEVTDL